MPYICMSALRIGRLPSSHGGQMYSLRRAVTRKRCGLLPNYFVHLLSLNSVVLFALVWQETEIVYTFSHETLVITKKLSSRTTNFSISL